MTLPVGESKRNNEWLGGARPNDMAEAERLRPVETPHTTRWGPLDHLIPLSARGERMNRPRAGNRRAVGNGPVGFSRD
ncbi:hypothetical protein EFW17_20810 [Halostreptopolyspora alba]|uniref:Uncharacterized protein n=1 Tax=Halostreptopolyspora alba TaxID=2487137 RepID=A0A3N0E2K2_9ACTN|nr:hypothetical protein EFW17_20810 [Nocardiopsaceae bacterium YIM 96095]